VLTVDGVVLKSVTDALLRVTVQTVEASGGGNVAETQLVVRRSHQLDVQLLDFVEAQLLDGKIAVPGKEQLVEVSVEQGHVARTFIASVHEVEEPQDLRSAVATRWLFRQWGQRTT
jgi:hypothetical protein